MPQPPARAGGTLPALTDVLTSAASYAQDEKAASTRRGYRSDWRDFSAWCDRMGLEPLPASPATAAAYFAHLADSGRSAGTIARRVAAIAYAHKLKGAESPTTAEAVRQVLRGIRRRIGVAPRQKAPATDRAIGAMLAHSGAHNKEHSTEIRTSNTFSERSKMSTYCSITTTTTTTATKILKRRREGKRRSKAAHADS